MVAGDGNGDWTIADGDASGRKITLAPRVNLVPSSTGEANFLAIDDGTTLLATSPISNEENEMVAGQLWSCPAYDVLEMLDPTYST